MTFLKTLDKDFLSDIIKPSKRKEIKKMTKEQEILHHMKVLKISREEAEQLYKDDHSNAILPEVAEIEKKAKTSKRHYERSTVTNKTNIKEPKIDTDKIYLISIIENALKESSISNFSVTNVQKTINITYNNNEYTINLVKHRQKKE